LTAQRPTTEVLIASYLQLLQSEITKKFDTPKMMAPLAWFNSTQATVFTYLLAFADAQSLDHIQRCHPGIKDCTMRLFQIATDKKNLRNNVLSFYVPFPAWKTIHRFMNKYII